nr:integrase, catalytic region, zinc finger, CCHC-type, peptidase aspartic, catalytic [Tanacetum cinerariifolium]
MWGFRLVDMISRIVDALVEQAPVVVEGDADSLAIERNLVLLWIVFCLGLLPVGLKPVWGNRFDKPVVKPVQTKKNPKRFQTAALAKNRNQFDQNQDLDTFSSVRRPRHRDVIWKKKGSSNNSNVGLSAVNVSNLNKNVKRYSHNDLLACNNSHLGETSCASVCDDAMNVSCDSRMNDLLDDNNFFIFDDVNVRISPVCKMPFRKKPRDSMHVRSTSNMIKSLPRTVHKWLPKLQPLSMCLWIIDSGCSNHMTGNRALLTNFVEKFLGTVHFGNNDFAMIAGYGDVIIGSMSIKKVYYVEGSSSRLKISFKIVKDSSFSKEGQESF